MNNTKSVNYLNNILQYLNDSFSGYQLNQEDVSDHRLKSTLENLCLDRATMIEEVKSKIEELGGTPTNSQTVAGALHQWYQDIKNVITGGDPLAISRQIRFGESTLIDEYKNVLKKEELPEDIRQLLIKQLSKIEDDLKEIEMQTVKN